MATSSPKEIKQGNVIMAGPELEEPGGSHQGQGLGQGTVCRAPKPVSSGEAPVLLEKNKGAVAGKQDRDLQG